MGDICHVPKPGAKQTPYTHGQIPQMHKARNLQCS
ncbi:hypothetical protein SLEP1_g28604 [Rubroshorea leprosula]|uniref:Uncharacterized protein n=1 Tax=Rubroshorea leprosula TaxID=152421 RepID=A0AAV5JZV4_9ROSI|nr:hypothetical protein SLEP1_g28604 [Rubroshorea leprosula]